MSMFQGLLQQIRAEDKRKAERLEAEAYRMLMLIAENKADVTALAIMCRGIWLIDPEVLSPRQAAVNLVHLLAFFKYLETVQLEEQERLTKLLGGCIIQMHDTFCTEHRGTEVQNVVFGGKCG